MAEISLNKTSTVLGIVASLIAIGAAVYYVVKNQKGVRTTAIRGVNFRKVRQRNRDAALGQPGRTRKYLGWRGTSSASGAGLAANLPPAVGRYSNPRMQQPQLLTFASPGNHPRKRRNLTVTAAQGGVIPA